MTRQTKVNFFRSLKVDVQIENVYSYVVDVLQTFIHKIESYGTHMHTLLWSGSLHNVTNRNILST